jgi:lysophospholipase L1-like esterase
MVGRPGSLVPFVDQADEFSYGNITGRPTAPFVRALARLLPGVGYVQRQHAAYAALWRAANVVALTKPGPRWIVLGDSMSQGVGATSFDAGWVNQVNDRLAADGRGYEIINLSASGARAPDVVEQQIPVWRALPPAPGSSSRPDLVTVLIGSNDLISSKHRDAFPAAFASLLALLPAGAVVSSLPQPRGAARLANEELVTAARDRGLVMVDMRRSGPPSWRGKLAEDHFHPNNAGYAGIADAFYEKIAGT